MNLAQALKKKNRVIQKINQLKQDVQTENSKRTDAARKIKVTELWEAVNKGINELIKLKIAIFIASTPMRENILRLGELKSKIDFIKGINTTEGKVSQYGTEDIEYSVEYDKIFVKKEIEKCEQEIDELQEELDTFNHKTEVEI